jgi:hypothetical protein
MESCCRAVCSAHWWSGAISSHSLQVSHFTVLDSVGYLLLLAIVFAPLSVALASSCESTFLVISALRVHCHRNPSFILRVSRLELSTLLECQDYTGFRVYKGRFQDTTSLEIIMIAMPSCATCLRHHGNVADCFAAGAVR